MEEQIINCFLLHAVGDTVGFNNSKWEFKYLEGSLVGTTLEKVYEFIDLGGVNGISLKGWIVSDDTILHNQTAKALLEPFKNVDGFMTNLKKHLLYIYKLAEKDSKGNKDYGFNKRAYGNSTINSVSLLKKNTKWSELPYDYYSGGSGASMRSLCIGLALHGKKKRHQLIQLSIESARLTNNSAVGYLGGMTSALFAALAIEGVVIIEWPFYLVELFKEGTIKRYIESAGRDVAEYERDSHVFVDKWIRYIENKFDSKKNIKKKKTDINFPQRSVYYYENFSFKPKLGISDKESYNNAFIGSGGDDSVIIAYDSLLDAGDNWEKLVFYSMLHAGDTDTTGAIAGGLYGILYGTKNVPSNFTEHIEFKKELAGVAKDLYKKFFSNNNNI